MFTCTNCGEEKADDERGSVGWWANLGFLFVAKAPWWPSPVCKDCSKKVRAFGIGCLIFVGVALLFFAILRFAPATNR
jgi:hypothetical protein